MNILKKTAAILALFIGAMSIFAGSKVLLGIDTKDYTILTWLLIYNIVMGFVSLFTAYLMWKNNYKAHNLITMILTFHFLVFIYLRFFSETAAHESQMAMLFRSVIWVVISVLYIQVPRILGNREKTKS
jgi:hypothetical protein